MSIFSEVDMVTYLYAPATTRRLTGSRSLLPNACGSLIPGVGGEEADGDTSGAESPDSVPV
jgi:hypothetical protein